MFKYNGKRADLVGVGVGGGVGENRLAQPRGWGGGYIASTKFFINSFLNIFKVSTPHLGGGTRVGNVNHPPHPHQFGGHGRRLPTQLLASKKIP